MEIDYLTLRQEHRLKIFENELIMQKLDLTGIRMESGENFAFYTISPHIVRMIKSRRFGWAGHIARIGEARNV